MRAGAHHVTHAQPHAQRTPAKKPRELRCIPPGEWRASGRRNFRGLRVLMGVVVETLAWMSLCGGFSLFTAMLGATRGIPSALWLGTVALVTHVGLAPATDHPATLCLALAWLLACSTAYLGVGVWVSAPGWLLATCSASLVHPLVVWEVQSTGRTDWHPWLSAQLGYSRTAWERAERRVDDDGLSLVGLEYASEDRIVEDIQWVIPPFERRRLVAAGDLPHSVWPCRGRRATLSHRLFEPFIQWPDVEALLLGFGPLSCAGVRQMVVYYALPRQHREVRTAVFYLAMTHADRAAATASHAAVVICSNNVLLSDDPGAIYALVPSAVESIEQRCALFQLSGCNVEAVRRLESRWDAARRRAPLCYSTARVCRAALDSRWVWTVIAGFMLAVLFERGYHAT